MKCSVAAKDAKTLSDIIGNGNPDQRHSPGSSLTGGGHSHYFIEGSI